MDREEAERRLKRLEAMHDIHKDETRKLIMLGESNRDLVEDVIIRLRRLEQEIGPVRREDQ